MPDYRRIDNGQKVAANDPNRGIWYGWCGFWTDDWDRVKPQRPDGIPCCPKCGCYGYMAEAHKWESGIPGFVETHPEFPRYAEFVEFCKGKCGAHDLGLPKKAPLTDAYAKWDKENPKKEDE